MNRIKSSITFLALLAIACQAQQYNLVWQDEFNGNSLDRSKWNFEINCNGGGNNEHQCYTDKGNNLFVRDGHLTIQAVPEAHNGKQYTSSRITTQHAASWTYGKFEIRARLPRGDYLWPAIWMMPRDSVYGSWAASGEIDIVEARGQAPRVVEGTIHHGSGWPNNVYTGSGPRTFDVDFTTDFHVFELIWTRDQMQWLVDGRVYHTQNLVRNFYSGRGANPYNNVRQPFDQRFFMILNLAVGGGFFGGQANAINHGIARGWPRPQMLIDYVRVYQEGGSPIVPPVPVPTSQNTPRTSAVVNPPAVSNPSTGACSGRCGAGACCEDQRNGAVCYDANAYECPTDSSNGRKLLCGKGLGACSGVCFDSNNYICQSGRIAQKPAGWVPPANSQQPPRTSNQNPPAQTQNNNGNNGGNSNEGSVCPPGGCGAGSCCNDGAMGPVCFSPNTHVCARDNNGKFQLCGRGSGSCNGACFDANIYQCNGGSIALKN